MVLICIALMTELMHGTSDVLMGHLFDAFSGEMSIQILCPFLVRAVFLLFSFKNSVINSG